MLTKKEQKNLEKIVNGNWTIRDFYDFDENSDCKGYDLDGVLIVMKGRCVKEIMEDEVIRKLDDEVNYIVYLYCGDGYGVKSFDRVIELLKKFYDV